MTQDQDRSKNLEIQKDILLGRKFSLADVIGQQAGNFLKGESPVPKLSQVALEINQFIKQNLSDSSGALQAILQALVKADESTLSKYLDSPLSALKEILTTIINNEYLFYDFVKQVDVKWGEMFNERPYFQQPGQSPHPEDEYTHDSVRKKLLDLLEMVKT